MRFSMYVGEYGYFIHIGEGTERGKFPVFSLELVKYTYGKLCVCNVVYMHTL